MPKMGNYRCYFCSKEFWRESSLEKHLDHQDCPRLQIGEYNSREGIERSDALFNLMDVLVKQKKTFIEGSLTHKDTGSIWKYKITKQTNCDQG